MKDKKISQIKHIGHALRSLEMTMMENDKEKRQSEITRWQDNFRKVYDMPEDDHAAERWSQESEENWTAHAMYMLAVTAKHLK